ncbi:MAG: VOC family protein [Acidobacteria bacterium]|nr:VOC family protein [Acidobacteriota bacterium]
MPIALTGEGADVGITARDPARLAAFYRDFLGLPLAKELSWPDQGAQVWFFAIGDGHLKILGFDHPPTAANPAGGNRTATGFRYVAIAVERIDDGLAGLEEAGGAVAVPPATHGASRVVFITDPEGNSIELIERRPE